MVNVKKNYDYFILLTLIIFSLIMRILSYYLPMVYSTIPCFLLQQGEFIYFSTLRYITKFIDLILLNLNFLEYYKLIGILIENFIGSLILFLTYFIGKRLYLKYNINWLRILLIILFVIYTFNIITASVIVPIARCIVFGSLF